MCPGWWGSPLYFTDHFPSCTKILLVKHSGELSKTKRNAPEPILLLSSFGKMYIHQTPCSRGWSTNSFVTHSVTRWVTLFLKGTRGQWKMLYKGQWKVPSTQRLTLCGRHLFIDPYKTSFIDPYTAFSLTLSQNLCEVVKLVGGESDINGATLSFFFVFILH